MGINPLGGGRAQADFQIWNSQLHADEAGNDHLFAQIEPKRHVNLDKDELNVLPMPKGLSISCQTSGI